MYPNINLIPQQEVQEQTKVKLVKVSTIISIVILVLVSAISAYFFFTATSLKTEKKTLEEDIKSVRNNINSLSQTEVTVRNLDKKYSTLARLLSSRVYYSLLLTELRARQPQTVTIESFDVRGSKLNISGRGTDYISISLFVANLLNKDFGAGNPDLKKLFTSVSLDSVSLESRTNMVLYAITVDYDTALVKKK